MKTNKSRTEISQRSSLDASDEALQATAANFTCTSTVVPTLFAWEGEGVWTLQLQQGPDWVSSYISIPDLLFELWHFILHVSSLGILDLVLSQTPTLTLAHCRSAVFQNPNKICIL